MPVSKRKLLLADDSITIQKVVNLTFADEGIEVVTAGDGDAAMQKFVEIKPDLVMVDVNMPGMDGYRICELIKQDDETRQIPVILLVGSFEPFNEAEARRVGADDYLTKPFQSIRQLVSKVSFLLDSKTKESVEDAVFALPANEYAKPENRNSESLSGINFGDAEMDDDMIQANQINNLSASPERQLEARAVAEKPSIDFPPMPLRKPYDYNSTASVTAANVSKTQPLTAADLTEISSKSTNLKETSGETFSAAADLPSFSKRYIIEESKVSEQKPVEKQDFSAAIPAESKSGVPVKETPAMSAPSKSTELLNFDELDLLELPMLENDEISAGDEEENPTDLTELSEPLPEIPELLKKSPEVSPVQPEAAPKTDEENKASEETSAKMPETAESFEMAETFDRTKNEAEKNENSAPMINFPPDLIEAIASKVAEKISARAVREIASEVTPQMVEMIIKQMAKEKIQE